MIKTAWVISSAKCGLRTCRNAVEKTRSTWRETSAENALSEPSVTYSCSSSKSFRSSIQSRFLNYGRPNEKRTLFYSFSGCVAPQSFLHEINIKAQAVELVPVTCGN